MKRQFDLTMDEHYNKKQKKQGEISDRLHRTNQSLLEQTMTSSEISFMQIHHGNMPSNITKRVPQ
jgi:hypothetical protein